MGGDAGREGRRDVAAPDGRLDRVHREHERGETTAQAIGDRVSFPDPGSPLSTTSMAAILTCAGQSSPVSGFSVRKFQSVTIRQPCPGIPTRRVLDPLRRARLRRHRLRRDAADHCGGVSRVWHGAGVGQRAPCHDEAWCAGASGMVDESCGRWSARFGQVRAIGLNGGGPRISMPPFLRADAWTQSMSTGPASRPRRSSLATGSLASM